MFKSPARVGTLVALSLLAAVAPSTVSAQQPDPKPVTPWLDFSGLILGNFRYTYDSLTKAANGGHAANKFDIERVYLNFRMPAGEKGSIRVTTDVFNQGSSPANAYYAGWTVRLKYAYFQYNLLNDIGSNKGFNLALRAGMLHTVLIDHEEGFWPRYLSQTAVERNGFFASSDLGVAAVVSLPDKLGEVYATVQNGNGYGVSEVDPYKEYSARLSITPFGAQNNIAKTFTISPWIDINHTASKFIGTPGATSDITDGLKKNRVGVFAGLKDRRLTLGAEYAKRTETTELGATLPIRTSYDNSGTLISGFAVIRPFEFVTMTKSPFGLVARIDNFKPIDNATAAGTQTVDAANQLIIAGVFYDLTSKATFAIDAQTLTPKNGSTTARVKTVFAHMSVAF
jgi:hypothetical protein